VLALLVALHGCGSTSPAPVAIGSVGAVLARDEVSGAVFVRDVPLADELDRGLLPGDELLMIDGVFVRPLSGDELRGRLRGTVGSKVALTVTRGSDVVRLELQRMPLLPARGRGDLAPVASAVVSP
jgi:carboxyl-terminal processing protease